MNILISSLGRCGSTMLYNAIQCSHKRFSLNVTQLLEGVTKSHCYAPENINGRAIFLIGDPYDIVKTSYRKIIKKEEKNKHFQNFQVPTDYDYQLKILEQDVLRLENHFDSWYTIHNYPCLVFNYEYMWEYHEMLEDYTQHKIVLPKKRNRKPVEITSQQEELIHHTYHSLKQKIDACGPFKIFQ